MRSALALLFVCGIAGDAAAQAVPTSTTEKTPIPNARIAPSFDGHIGAWLLLGPYKSATNGVKAVVATTPPNALAMDPPTVTESAFAPSAPQWMVAQTNAGAIDVKAAFKGNPLANGMDLIAYAAGTLHLARAEKIYMLLGSDDGVRVSVDGKVVLTRDEARPQRDDDDMIPLDLAAGDHPILLKLHQRDGAWSFRVRFVDARLAPPDDAWVSLAGVGEDRQKQLASQMARGYFDLGTRADSYVMHLHARFTEGAPIGVPLHIKASLDSVFDIDAGAASLDSSDIDVQLPALSGAAALAIEDKDIRLRADIAGRVVTQTFHPRKSIREAIKRSDEMLARIGQGTRPAWLREDTIESLQNARNRLAAAQNRGDTDVEALTTETRELTTSLDALDHDKDPYATRTGVMRMAYRSPIDGALAEYGLYVPPSYTPAAKRKWPLVVALHGMNGRSMAMMRWFFGGDDPKREQDWEERHVDPLPPLDAFVITPSAYGNSMYRDMGEDDPLRVLDRIVARYPIDENRVSATGPSMGGIGSAAIPFRHPDRFSSAEPLCGYHSYLIRRDIAGHPIRPWERVLAEERSNVEWALNGWGLPLFIVHGTKDLPVENSGVLIDTYEKLHYSVEHEHPELGHNVWQQTYENLRGAKWLIDKRRDPRPRRVRFRTMRLRDDKSYWVHVGELSTPDGWGQVDARAVSKTAINVTTSGIAELMFDRDAFLFDAATMTITIDGQTLTFGGGDGLVMHREGTAWKNGRVNHGDKIWKRGAMTGPIRDVFHEPILFVWGASDPAQSRANEEVARAWAQVRGGMTVRYPIISDTEFLARGESLANDRALFLVGNAKSNAVTRAFEGDLPIKLDGESITMASQRFTGDQLGAAFIQPNPKRTDRYLAVVEGTTALGTWRSLSLPDLLPDFVIYDVSVAPARGQMLLSAGAVKAGGFFKNDWSLPEKTDDPLASTVRPGAKNEYEATPYLP